jgi:transcriptional regulator with XRE-family HTH domain
MTAMTPPADPRRYLAATLRGLRADAGLSTTRLATLLGWSQSKISKTELGRTVPPPSDVEAWARATGATPAVRDELVRIAEDTAHQATEWRRELAPGRRRKQEEIQRLEAAASVIRVFGHDVIPGLAQTRPYIEAMFRLGRQVGPPEEPDQEVVEARLSRQAVLDNSDKTFHLLMSETALRRRLVSPADMRRQLDHLSQLASRGNVTVGVIPFDAQERVHQYHGFAIMGDPETDDGALVLAETLTRAVSIRSATEVTEYVAHFDGLRQAAVEGESLRSFLQEVIAEFPAC